MRKILIITKFSYKSNRGGGITTAQKNIFYNLNDIFNLENYFSFKDLNNKTTINFIYYFKICKLLFHNSFNIIYINGFFSFSSSIIPIILSRFLSKSKCIISPRGMLKPSAIDNKKALKIFLIRIYKILLSHKTIFHVTDDIEFNEVRKYFKNNIHIATDFPPIRNNLFSPVTKEINELNLIYVGRIDNLKNLYGILHNLNQFKLNSNYNVKINFNIIGDIVDQQYWNKCLLLINILNEKYNIQYLGYINNDKLIQYFEQSHLFISLSEGENFGYTIAESLSCSIPVIISKNTPFRDISKYGFGYDIDLLDNEMFCNSLLKFAKMNQNDYNNFRFKLSSNFKKYYNLESIKESYINLLNS